MRLYRNIMSQHPMIRNQPKPKLLLDENFEPRIHLPKLNQLYDVKHVAEDLHKGGISDSAVYALAVKQGRLVVTYNEKDFRSFAKTSVNSGVIGVSTNLTAAQIDTKLVALLKKSSQKGLYGAYHYISGESRS